MSQGRHRYNPKAKPASYGALKRWIHVALLPMNWFSRRWTISTDFFLLRFSNLAYTVTVSCIFLVRPRKLLKLHMCLKREAFYFARRSISRASSISSLGYTSWVDVLIMRIICNIKEWLGGGGQMSGEGRVSARVFALWKPVLRLPGASMKAIGPVWETVKRARERVPRRTCVWLFRPPRYY